MPNPARGLALMVEGYASYVAKLGAERAERAIRLLGSPKLTQEIIDAWTGQPHRHRPNDDPKPGDWCKDCEQAIVWTGPGMDDWDLVDEAAVAEHHEQRLTALAGSLNVDPEDLDEVVHDLTSKQASAINNGGLGDQIAFLLRHLPMGEVEQEIRGAAHSEELV